MKNKAIFISLLLLSALLLGCLEGNSNKEKEKNEGEGTLQDVETPSKDPDPPEAKKFTSMKEAEEAGLLPVLDRSDTLRGTDANSDGIRDDIASYISTLQLSEEERSSLRYISYALQETLLVDLKDRTALDRVAEQLAKAANCVYIRISDPRLARRYINIIEGQNANTKKRSEQYMNYNLARSGSVLKIPTGDTCEKF